MRFKLVLLLCIVLTATLIGAVQPAHAAPLTFFTQRADFVFSAPGLTSETFESGTVGTNGLKECEDPLSSTNDVSGCFTGLKAGVTFFGDGDLTPGLALLGRNTTYQTPSKTLIANWNIESFAMEFSIPVNSVGMDLMNLDLQPGTSQQCEVAVYDANGIKGTMIQTCGNKGTGFAGVQSDTPITAVIITAPNPAAGGFEGIDNLLFGNVDFTTTVANPAIIRLSPLTTYLLLSANLTKGGDPLAGKTIDFLINNTKVCSGTTDAGGNASCGGPVDVVSVALSPTMTYTAKFSGEAGDPPLGPSSGSAGLIEGLPEPPPPPI